MQEIAVHVFKCALMCDGFYGLSGPCWFLRAMFFALLFYGVFAAGMNRLRSRRIILVLVSTVSVLMISLSWIGYGRPFCYLGGATAMTGFGLLHLGILLREFDLRIEKFSVFANCLLILFCAAALSFLTSHGEVRLDENKFPSVGFLVTTSVLGWFFLNGVARILTGFAAAPVLSYIGMHTIPILLFHFAAFKVVSGIGILVVGTGSLAAIRCYSGSFWCLMYTIAGVLLPLALLWSYEKFILKMLKEMRCK